MAIRWSRRSALISLSQVTTIAPGAFLYGGAAALPLLYRSTAWAQDLNTQERIAHAYQSRFFFDARGEANVSVGVAQGVTRLRLTSPRGIQIGLGPDSRSRVGAPIGSRNAVKRWDFWLHRTKGAALRYGVELEKVPVHADSALAAARKRWTGRGLAFESRESGTLSGLSGKVLDTRAIALVHGSFARRTDAHKVARRLQSRYGIPAVVRTQTQKYAAGFIVAKDPQSGLELRIEGALWCFSADAGIRVEVDDRARKLSKGQRFGGRIGVIIGSDGKLSVACEGPETMILSGVVPAEIPASAPTAALQAQSIAARGQLLAKVGHRHEEDPFSLCADVHCQAFGGRDHEDRRSNAAILRTRGQLLMRPGASALVDTVYSANSGGYSEHNENVWPAHPDPQLRARPDLQIPTRFAAGIGAHNLEDWLSRRHRAHCCPRGQSDDAYRWTRLLNAQTLAQNPHWTLPKAKVEAMMVLSRGQSGRATKLAVQLGGKSYTLEGELNIRRHLGGLRSSMFLLKAVDKGWLAVGGGYGHGVGMCQYGAMGMARAGFSAPAILSHYYRQSEVRRFW